MFVSREFGTSTFVILLLYNFRSLGIPPLVASGFAKLEEKKKRIDKRRQTTVKSLFGKRTTTASKPYV